MSPFLYRPVKFGLRNNKAPDLSEAVPSYLIAHEFVSILGSLNPDKYGGYIMALALRMELELGLRRGELGGLQWDDIDFENNTMTIRNNLVYLNNSVMLGSPKTEESQRDLYVSDELLGILNSHRAKQAAYKKEYGALYETNVFDGKECNFVMSWENGKYIHPNYYTLKFKRLMDANGIEKRVRFHDLSIPTQR